MMKDPFLTWNEVALEANKVSHSDGSGEQTGPTLSSRALAIVHIAMYDAYAGVINNSVSWPPYITPTISPPANSSQTRFSAVAGAAFTALTRLFPSQKAYFETQLQLNGDKNDSGHTFGVHTANNILQDRKDDPKADAGNHRATNGKPNHQVDPDNSDQKFHAPLYGEYSKGFAITMRHALETPPFANTEYITALQEVRAKGCKPELMGTLPDTLGGVPTDKRSPEETLIGIFWGYDGAKDLGTPPRLYNQIVRKIAEAKNTGANSWDQNARLFTLVNVAMGDAGILAWREKFKHDFWRPVVGIREHDLSCGVIEDGKPMPASDMIDVDSDPFWLPLGAPASNSTKASLMSKMPTYPFVNMQNAKVKNFTPNFPAYPSGHATFGAAALHMVRLFYGVPVGNRSGDTLLKDMFFVSEEMNNNTQDNEGTVRPLHRRSFEDGLWDMIIENGRSRVFLGVHWVFDAFAVDDEGNPDLSRCIGGVPLGLNIAEDIFQASGGKGPAKSNVTPCTPEEICVAVPLSKASRVSGRQSSKRKNTSRKRRNR